MFKHKKEPEVVIDDITTPGIADRGRDAFAAASDYIVPKARACAENVRPKVKSAANDLNDFLQPKAQELTAKGAAFASEKMDDLQPKLAAFASDARDKAQPYVDEHVTPHVDKARSKVSPLVDAGVDRFNSDLRPLMEDAYSQVSSTPQAQEARKRLTAASAALAGDLVMPEPQEVAKKKNPVATVFQVLAALGLIAGIGYAIKKFLTPDDGAWQAQSPVQPMATAPTAAPAKEAPKEYGEGAYVGENPPEGFTIKGNERSMKYHVEGSTGFDRTIADVWFNSEDAATAAGFTKAQR